MRVAPTVTSGAPFSRTGGDRPPGTDVDTADSLIVQPYPVANCLTARMHKGINSTLDEGQTPVVGFNARQDPDSWVDRTGPLDTDGSTQAIVAPTITATNDPSRSPQSSEVTQQVWAVMQATQAVAFQQIADCLTAAYGTKWNGNASADNGSLFAAQPVAMRESGQGYWMQDDIAGTLRAEGEDRPSRPSHVIQQQVMQVRRLTPVECERLQGFPDGYTNIPWRGKSESPDGPRYKTLGNSMAVPVMRWIGERMSAYVNRSLA